MPVSSTFWIGLNDFNNSGIWSWPDKTKVIFKHWASTTDFLNKNNRCAIVKRRRRETLDSLVQEEN